MYNVYTHDHRIATLLQAVLIMGHKKCADCILEAYFEPGGTPGCVRHGQNDHAVSRKQSQGEVLTLKNVNHAEQDWADR